MSNQSLTPEETLKRMREENLREAEENARLYEEKNTQQVKDALQELGAATWGQVQQWGPAHNIRPLTREVAGEVLKKLIENGEVIQATDPETGEPAFGKTYRGAKAKLWTLA
ncbi:hypothetical protein [Corynebacterium striatum]|uniref:hypothetical protein n=1 Tax=Corynebacterium striatum TaxID=43770 RepID=UPI000667D5F7|nr:hypothetical protein [Corynebacterium striatum]